MYADIKESDKLMITRPNNTETMILKDIMAQVKNGNRILKMSEITDESGNFGGLFLTAEQNINKKQFNVMKPLNRVIDMNPNTTTEIIVDVEPCCVTILTSQPADGLEVTVRGNRIIIEASEILEDTITYTVVNDGYETLKGKLEVHVIPHQAISMNVLKDETVSVLVLDEKGTKLIPEEITSTSVLLENIVEGAYKILTRKFGEQEYIEHSTYIVDEDDMVNGQVIVDIKTYEDKIKAEPLSTISQGQTITYLDNETSVDNTLADKTPVHFKNITINNPTDKEVYKVTLYFTNGNYNEIQLLYKKNGSYLDLVRDGYSTTLDTMKSITEALQEIPVYVMGRMGNYKARIEFRDANDDIIAESNPFYIYIS